MWRRHVIVVSTVATGNIGDSLDRQHQLHVSDVQREVPFIEPG